LNCCPFPDPPHHSQHLEARPIGERVRPPRRQEYSR